MDRASFEQMSIGGWILGRLLRILIVGGIAAFIIWIIHSTSGVNKEFDSDDQYNMFIQTEAPPINDSKFNKIN